MKNIFKLITALILLSHNALYCPPEKSSKELKKLEYLEENLLREGGNHLIYLCAACKHYSGREITKRARRILLQDVQSYDFRSPINMFCRTSWTNSRYWPRYHHELLALRATEHEGCRVIQERLQEFEKKSKEKDIKRPENNVYEYYVAERNQLNHQFNLKTVGISPQQRKKMIKDLKKRDEQIYQKYLDQFKQAKREYCTNMENLINEIF